MIGESSRAADHGLSGYFEQNGLNNESKQGSTKGVSGRRFSGDAAVTDVRHASRFRTLLRLAVSSLLFRSNTLQAELFSKISLQPAVFTFPERELSQRRVTAERRSLFSVSVFIFVSVPLRLRTSRIRFFLLLSPVLRIFPVSLLLPTLVLRIRVLFSRLSLLWLSLSVRAFAAVSRTRKLLASSRSAKMQATVESRIDHWWHYLSEIQ